MILADANIWIHFFRQRNPLLRKLLENNQVVMHPYLIAELALGSLHHRQATLARLDNMPMAKLVELKDVRRMIETRVLYAKGIGLIDAHLVASCLATPGTSLWTEDVKLGSVAAALGLCANFL